MVDTGATITWEAWDQKYKPNQDWNHAWGTRSGESSPTVCVRRTTADARLGYGVD